MHSTRKAALASGATRYFTGKECKNGHRSERFATSGGCVTCQSLRSDPVKHLVYSRRWKSRNAARCATVSKAWIAQNIEKRRRHIREGRRRWARDPANKAKVNLWAANRRAAKLKRTPSWVDKKAIAAIYESCPDGFHVDHIVPLQGQTVSGLHVPWNLQVIPARENLRKSATWPQQESLS